MSPEFEKRLRREIRVRLQEMRDGCVDCLACGGWYCRAHYLEALDLILHPRKCLDLGKAKAGAAK